MYLLFWMTAATLCLARIMEILVAMGTGKNASLADGVLACMECYSIKQIYVIHHNNQFEKTSELKTTHR